MAAVQRSELEQEPYDPEEFVERLAWRSAPAQQQHQAGGTSGQNPFEQPTAAAAAASSSAEFDAQLLNDAFVQAIKDLSVMREKQQKICQQLEQKCLEEELANRKRISSLLEKNRTTASTYKSLDEKINSVATKVIHLGDQLESVNTPRARDVEALKLMRHFEEFLGGETSLSSVFNDKSKLHEAADIILKLQLIAQELPTAKFEAAKTRIDDKYAEIERLLIEEFVKSHRSKDLHRMKDLAQILSQFKGYSACIDAFIEQIQLKQYREKDLGGGGGDIFRDIMPLCESSWKTISQVFPNPKQVMSRFVLNIFHNRLKEHVAVKLADKNNTEAYLNNLFQLYSQTTKLATELSRFSSAGYGRQQDLQLSGGASSTGTAAGLGHGDSMFLSSQARTIFRDNLETYISTESRYLNDRCAATLRRFYESRRHQKRPPQQRAMLAALTLGVAGGGSSSGSSSSGGGSSGNSGIGTSAAVAAAVAAAASPEVAAVSQFQDLKRDLHGFIASRAPQINNIMASTSSSASQEASGGQGGGETFLSEEVAITILQLTKTAFRRCQVLSDPKELPSNAAEIFSILISYLLHEHVDYALEIGLQSIPGPDCRAAPELAFFEVVGQTNTVIHLFEKQFSDSLVPLVEASPKQGECQQRKKSELEKLENKLDAGLDRALTALIGWVRNLLVSEQKKSDFNPFSGLTGSSGGSGANNGGDPPGTTSGSGGGADGGVFATSSSAACLRVVKFVNGQVDRIRECLDGKNIELVLLELGIRLHRTIYDHLQGFTYSSTGVMSVICDVQEYRRCVAGFKVAAANNLFDTLYAMCNLLILPPENLRGATQGDMLASLDRTILDNWIQLRADYKSEKLGTYL